MLAKLPKSQQPKAKRALQEIWTAETKIAAEAAFDAFIRSYELKYAKAAQCLAKDRDALLVFYDFSRRALETFENHKSDRKHVRDGASPHHSLQGLPFQ